MPVTVKRKSATTKSTLTKKNTKKTARRLASKKKTSLSESYDRYKFYEGKQYTGMQVGRSHKWFYDKGEWKETKVRPDMWRMFYSVVKRRAGKAPKGSGVPVGTGYHWYIMAHQNVTKLNANDYSTTLMGLKFKVAHKRAAKGKWSSSAAAQRKTLLQFFQEMITELKKKPLELDFEYKNERYKGEALPVPGTCHDGVCYELDVMINNESYGIIRSGKTGWKMDNVPDQKFVNAVGAAIMEWYN
jgi:hypothetical protein